ncbi:MAG TPA: group III truncated hemoglobin, partial [Ilumatobacteraceae bacterium]|nr:group III truncated hemoglobin [Ilumatobacteraceae bacterium]
DFYRQAAMDDVLGPIFEATITDWNHHIAKLTDFWAWQLFGVRGYEGNPLIAHRPVHEQMPFRAEHYQRWLELFTETVDLDYVGPVAEAAKQRATKMANAMQRLLDGVSDRGDAPVQPILTTRPT